MPKSYAGRNAAEGINGRFRQVFPSKYQLLAKSLEMAVGQAFKRYFPAGLAGVAVTSIGTVIAGVPAPRFLDAQGREIPLKHLSYSHF